MRTAAQARYAIKNKELLRTKDMRANHHNAARDAENRNQRNSDLGWRWLAWSRHFRKRLIFDYEQLRIVSGAVLENPKFTLIYGGKRCYDDLHSPLPRW